MGGREQRSFVWLLVGLGDMVHQPQFGWGGDHTELSPQRERGGGSGLHGHQHGESAGAGALELTNCIGDVAPCFADRGAGRSSSVGTCTASARQWWNPKSRYQCGSIEKSHCASFPHTFSRISNLYWFMRLDAQRLLSVLRLPARLTLDEAGYLLGFHPEGISFLVSAKILEPLGDPPEGAPLWFAAAQIMQLRTDQKWLSKATKAVRFHIKEKNEKAKAKRGEPNPLVDSGDRVVSGGRCAIH